MKILQTGIYVQWFTVCQCEGVICGGHRRFCSVVCVPDAMRWRKLLGLSFLWHAMHSTCATWSTQTSPLCHSLAPGGAQLWMWLARVLRTLSTNISKNEAALLTFHFSAKGPNTICQDKEVTSPEIRFRFILLLNANTSVHLIYLNASDAITISVGKNIYWHKIAWNNVEIVKRTNIPPHNQTEIVFSPVEYFVILYLKSMMTYCKCWLKSAN